MFLSSCFKQAESHLVFPFLKIQVSMAVLLDNFVSHTMHAEEEARADRAAAHKVTFLTSRATDV